MGHYLYTPGCNLGRCCTSPQTAFDPGVFGNLRKWGPVSSDPGLGQWVKDYRGNLSQVTYPIHVPAGQPIHTLASDNTGVYVGLLGAREDLPATAKYDLNGVQLWMSDNDNDMSYAGIGILDLEINNAGQLIEHGYRDGISVVRKLNISTGAEIWSNESDGNYYTMGLAIDSSDNIYVTQQDAVLKLSDADGSITTTYTSVRNGGAVDIAHSGGNFYVVGPSENHPVSGTRSLQKLDSSFTELWYADPDGVGLWSVVADGTVVAALGAPATTSDGLVVYNDSGTFQWRGDGIAFDWFGSSNHLALDNSSNIYTTAITTRVFPDTIDPSTINFINKFNSSGTLQWSNSVGYGVDINLPQYSNVEDVVTCLSVNNGILYSGQHGGYYSTSQDNL